MWASLLCLVGLLIFEEFRSLVKRIPISLMSSILRKKQQISLLSRGVRHLRKPGGIVSAIRIVKGLSYLKLRLWLSCKLEMGHLKIHPKHYELIYYNGSQRYKVIFPKKRGPRKIIFASTQEGKNVTQEIFEAMGPSRDFYDIRTSPKLLGYPEGLKVTYRSGATVHYLPDDAIKYSNP